MAARRFTVTRTNTETGAVWAPQLAAVSERDARTYVAHCATDNLGMSRKDAASRAAGLPLDGTPYRVGHYEFVVTPEPSTPSPTP